MEPLLIMQTATVLLLRNAELSNALGRNARAAAIAHYTWDAHVAKLWTFARDAGEATSAEAAQ